MADDETLDQEKLIRQARERAQLQTLDAAQFENRLQRRLATRIHQVIPSEWFAPASSECRDLYVDGHYYGCISLCQAVAEGLAKFLLAKNDLPEAGQHKQRCLLLRKKGVISEVTRLAFICIEGDDRNAIHHLNRDVPQDHDALKRRAEECVDALYAIEKGVFAYGFGAAGTLELHHPEYWTVDGQLARVFIRAT